MTAAAAAARAGDALVSRGTSPALALAAVVAGGLVEGTALGVLQARALRVLDASGRRAWVIATVLVAGVGWAAASAPAVLAEDTGGGASPPIAFVATGALLLGAALGSVLGAAQALALRGRVARPWRWPAVSAAGWAPAMAVIYLAASAPSAASPWPAVVVLGTVAGAVAGTVLGLVSGALMPLLDDTGVGPDVESARRRSSSCSPSAT